MSDRLIPSKWEGVPADSGWLDVGESHLLHWRSFGHLEAKPVIAVHGGPGSGANLRHLMFFDPQLHRVVMIDQRGTGQSTSSSAIFANTTQHLVEDIEKLRHFLAIERWLVFGVSWGACLALLYCQTHPQASNALVLAGLPNRHDYQSSWILDTRARLLPERHHEFLTGLAPGERADPVTAYYRRVLSSDRKHQLEATYAVWLLEAGLNGPEPETLTPIPLSDIDEDMVNRARIYLHYWANRSFLPKGHLLINANALTGLAVTFIHGAADWICPLSGAQLVADAIETAKLTIVPATGHSPYGADMAEALREAILAAS